MGTIFIIETTDTKCIKMIFNLSSIFISLSPPTKKTGLVPVFFVGYESTFELLLVALPRIEFASATKGVVSSIAKASSQLIPLECISVFLFTFPPLP